MELRVSAAENEEVRAKFTFLLRTLSMHIFETI
jgi:hypothetical protein